MFLERVLSDFLSFSISFFFGEPSPTPILLHEYSGLRVYTFFRERVFSRSDLSKIIKFPMNSCPVFAQSFFNVDDFFGIDFRIDFLIDF